MELPQVWPDPAQPWEARRQELIAALLREEYGELPRRERALDFEETARDEKFCAGKAVLIEAKITAEFENGAFSFPVKAAVPQRPGKHPFFVHLNFRDSVPDKYQPTEELIDRGYGVVTVCYQDISRDENYGELAAAAGVERVMFEGLPRAQWCGKLRLWAWSASCALDYAQTLPQLDPARAAVAGHSRLGKTALLAGALDPRFCCAFSNDSGCSGAALHRGKGEQAESIEAIVRNFPYWFTEGFARYAGRENELPFDQHFLVAAMAPRRVYVASAALDLWADPAAELACCRAASTVYERLGAPGLIAPDRPPQVGDAFHGGRIGYHLRAGRHYFSREDWLQYLAFLNQ